MSEQFLNGRVVLHCGDSREVLRGIADASIDSIVTDPPYALVSIQKRFGKPGSAPVRVGDVHASNDLKAAYARASAGFMGQSWDVGDTAFAAEFWAECLRVLKPGGHVVAFGGTRTYHRLACAIEDAGFEIRDMLSWLYGSGFPKSHNAGGGWGTALKPACEPICFGRKSLIGTVAANVLEHGTGAINIDACRVTMAPDDKSTERQAQDMRGGNYAGGNGKGYLDRTAGGHAGGRWPANIIHDGSEEVVEAFPDSPGQQGDVRGTEPSGVTDEIYGKFAGRVPAAARSDTGSAARFFYTAKADADDRLGSNHPTVKPVDLMQWLVRLVTPPDGVVLDPFAGTGTTGEAAFREGMRAVLVEREEPYQADIRRRMALAMGGPDERRRASEKEKEKRRPHEPLPLFGAIRD